MLDLMKFANMLSQGIAPTGKPFGNLFQPQVDQAQSPNQLDQIAQIFGHPNTTQFDKLSGLVNQIPQRSDFAQPSRTQSILQEIASLGSGVAPAGMWGGNPVGIKTDPMAIIANQQALRDQPYNRAIADFKTKEEPLEKLSQLESTRNTTDRTIANNILTQKLGQDKLEESARKTDLADKAKEDDRKIRQQRADAYEYRVMNPNKMIKEDSSGYFIAVDPQTGRTEYILDKEGDPIKSSNLDPRAKLNLMHENRMEEIGASGDEARKTKATPSGTPSTAKPPSATNEKTRLLNRAMQAINEHPEWKEFITPKQGGVFEVAAPASGAGLFSGGRDTSKDVKTLSEINNFIYGVPQGNQPTSINNTLEKDIPGHPGKKAISTDGGKTWKAK